VPGGQALAVALAGPIERMDRSFDAHAERLLMAARELSGLGAD